jgi:hypothetical protein
MLLLRNTVVAALAIIVVIGFSTPQSIAQGVGSPPAAEQNRQPRFPGMDQSVNMDLADKAGNPARKPYINVEEWGDLWNLFLLFGGGICGFIVGRRWDHIWGRRRSPESGTVAHKCLNRF